MDNIENINKNLSQTILRYPFNGRSKYLIDKFYIMGFDSKTLYRNLIENNMDDSINKSNSSLNISIEDLFSKSEIKKSPQIFHIPDPPTILNEITSDYKKQVPDKDLIKDMIFPNKLDFYYTEESLKIKSFHSTETNSKINNSLISKISSSSINELNSNIINNTDNTIFSNEEFNCIYIDDDNEKNNSKYIKPYNVIFSYNPQTENNSKKSINGFAHVFYRKYYKSKNIGEKIVSYFIPVIFCIISEFPFYNSFYLLCNQIKNLYKDKNLEVPIEILIYNIIKFTLSPLNNDIFLFIEPISFPTKKIELKNFVKENNKNNFNKIKEVDEENLIYENRNDNDNNEIFEEEIFEEIEEEENDNENNDNNNGKNIAGKYNSKIKINMNKKFTSNQNNFYKTRNRGNTNYKNYTRNKLDLMLNKNISNDNIFDNINEKNEENNINKDISPDEKSMRKSLSQKSIHSKNSVLRKTKKIKNKIKNVYYNKIRSNSKKENFKSFKINNSSTSSVLNIIQNPEKSYENIKFCFLPGYPLIQYNLIKVLLNTLSPQDVIIIFIHSFLEKDIVFFSKDIEYLSLTIDAYLNLNFPLNDEKYYFFNACVSYENYTNNNSTFVGSTFTTMLGVNNTYISEYKNTNMAKSKEHLCVDLDNGNLHFMKGEAPNPFTNNCNIFDFIKKICKNKDLKEERDTETILYREVKILYEKLNEYKNKLNNKSNNSDFYKYISKKDLIYYSENNNECNLNIKDINKDIQEAFYRMINNLSLYFYKNLYIKDEIIDPKKKTKEKLKTTSSIRQSLRNSHDIETMSIIFKKDYLLGDENQIYSKEELAFLEELTDTMKFESFVYGFIQSYNPIDLYKIPLTFTEEFLSILSRKNDNIKNIDFNFLSLIDKLYERNLKKNLFVDMNPFLSKYHKKYKIYFDREIYDIYDKNINSTIGINFRNINDNKIIIDSFKYKSYELDKNILLKYKTFINNLSTEEYHQIFYLSTMLEKNDIKNILLSDIENEIEKYSIDIGLLSKNDVCCSNIILLFIISIKDIIYYENMDCAGFLYSLSQYFIIFRKYYSMLINILYQLMKKSINNNNYIQAKKYYFCYYPCINSLRNIRLVPNESLMNIIKKFNSIKIDALLEKADNQNEKNNNQKELLLKYNTDLSYISYNFDKNKFYKENEIIEKINNIKENELKIYSTNENKKFTIPKIVYNDEKFKYKCKFMSQAKILEILTNEYNKFYNNDFDEKKLNIENIFNSCLNIDIFTRSSEDFKDKNYIIYSLRCIFDVYINKLYIKEKLNK